MLSLHRKPHPALGRDTIQEQAMNTVDDRHLEEITRLAWTAGPRAARREQAIAVRELAAAIRRWARGTRSACSGYG